MRIGAPENQRTAFRAKARIRIRLVDHQPFHVGAEPHDDFAFPGGRHLLEDLRLHLQVPRVVVLAGLEHRPRGRRRIAAALQSHSLHPRLAWFAKALVGRVRDHVVGAEFIDLERAGTDRGEVLQGALGCPDPCAVLELFVLDDRCDGTHERTVRDRFGHAERHPHGMVVKRFEGLYVGERCIGAAADLLVEAVLAGEHDVARRERGPVGPHHIGLQRPGNARHIVGHTAVPPCGNLDSQDGDHLAVVVVVRQRLDHERCRLDVLRSTG